MERGRGEKRRGGGLKLRPWGGCGRVEQLETGSEVGNLPGSVIFKKPHYTAQKDKLY